MNSDVPAEQPADPLAEALRLRASDADREKVADVLREAYAEGRLTAVEHSERLEETYRAQTYGDLIPVMRDLPVPPGTLAIPGANDVRAQSTDVSPGTPSVHRGLVPSTDSDTVAIFGAFERKGAWVVPAEMSATCIFGGGELDMTEARLTAQETVITAVAVFGGLEITVPDGMVVRSEAIGIFGGTQVPHDSPVAGAPVLVIKGAAIFGGIEVRRAKR